MLDQTREPSKVKLSKGGLCMQDKIVLEKTVGI